MELEDINISASTGLPSNEWTTFAGFNRVGLYSNNCIFTEPSSVQFYIDTASALLFVRYTEGKPLILLSDKDLKDGYVKVTIDGIDYQIKLVLGGVNDTKIGRWHDAFAIDNITGFYR